MEKPWLKYYPPGVPAEINPDAYQSLLHLFEQSCRQYKDRVAYSNLGTTLTYRQLWDKSRAFAAYLQNELNLRKGERIAIMLPNLLQYPIAMFGAFRAGLVVVNVNPLYTLRELRHQLNDAQCKALLVLSNFAYVAQEAIDKTPVRHVIVTDLGDAFPWPKSLIINFVLKYLKKMVPSWEIPHAILFKKVLSIGKTLPLHSAELKGEDIAYLQGTSGTTGVAKSAVLTHRNMIANMQQMYAWLQDSLTDEDIVITALPLYHIFSLTVNCLMFMSIGGQNVLITNPRDIPGFVKELSKIKFTAMSGVNTLFNALLNNAQFQKLDFNYLRITASGGMALQESVALRWEQLTGHPIIEGYGLTECSPVVTANPISITTFAGNIGYPLPSTELKICDENGNEVPRGEEGELCVKGPQVMREYWQKPEETANVFTPDGWLRTGDIALIDEQEAYHIVDRKKNMIVVSGFNVYPSEIEEVIAHMPTVAEVAVIGITDERSGELVKAYIVKKDPTLTEEQVLKHCAQHLTRYKIPRIVEFIDSLPKTNVGKILHRVLRDEGHLE